MTREQIMALDAMPDGARIGVRIINGDGLPTAEIRGGTFLQRPMRARMIAWMVALPGCNINVFEGDDATLTPGEITVRL